MIFRSSNSASALALAASPSRRASAGSSRSRPIAFASGSTRRLEPAIRQRRRGSPRGSREHRSRRAVARRRRPRSGFWASLRGSSAEPQCRPLRTTPACRPHDRAIPRRPKLSTRRASLRHRHRIPGSGVPASAKRTLRPCALSARAASTNSCTPLSQSMRAASSTKGGSPGGHGSVGGRKRAQSTPEPGNGRNLRLRGQSGVQEQIHVVGILQDQPGAVTAQGARIKKRTKGRSTRALSKSPIKT